MKMCRRDFLEVVVGAAGALAGGGARAAFGGADELKPCPPEAWTKHGIILEPTEPWEGDFVQCFTNTVRPLGDGRWQIWYSGILPKQQYSIARAEGVPGQRMEKIRAELSAGEAPDAPFAIGNLPEGWRPVQPTYIALPDGRHRLYFWVHGPGVVRYLAAESDDNRRYRVLDPLKPVLYHISDRAAHGVPNPDGVMAHKEKAKNRPAGEPLAEPRQITNDAVTIYQLPDGTFEIYAATLLQVPKGDPAYIPEDNAPGKIRVIDRLTSSDGLRIDGRHRAIDRDSHDPADQQFYYLSVTHTPRGRVGMLGHYRCAAQTMDLEWCFSKDGQTWQRPARGPWLKRGAPPAPDCMGVYGSNSLVYHDGLWHLFYTGVNHGHNAKLKYGKPRQVIMYATAKSIWG